MLIYDSTNPYDIPTTAEAVAGYVDGLYAWDINGWARFPSAAKIGISVNPFNQIGDALDVETGDATPAQAPAWVKVRLSQGAKQPWVYVNRANQRATEDAMWAAGIGPSQVGMWIATLDGSQSVPQYRYPIAAVQYANSNLSGGHYDLSITTAYGATTGVLEADLTPDQERKLDSAIAGIRSLEIALRGASNAEETALAGPYTQQVRAYLGGLIGEELAKHPAGSPAPVDLSPVLAAQSVTNAKVDVVAGKLSNLSLKVV